MANRDRRQLVEQLDQVEILERATTDLGDHGRDVVAVVLDVDLGGVRHATQIERDIGEQIDVTLCEGEQDEEQLAARLGLQAADHAQVQQPDSVVGPEHVARVGVGMEEAVFEDLLVVGLDQLPPASVRTGLPGHRAAEPPRRSHR